MANGMQALSGADDGTLRLWDLDTHECLQTLTGHINRITAITVDWKGEHALSGSSDSSLRHWDLSTGKCLHCLLGHADTVRCIVSDWSGQYSPPPKPSPDDDDKNSDNPPKRPSIVKIKTTLALSGSDDSSIRLWDMESEPPCQKVLEGHEGLIWTMEVDWASMHVLSGSDDKTLRLWDLSEGNCVQTIDTGSWVRALATNWSTKRALTASCDTRLRLWDLATGDALWSTEGNMGLVRAVLVDWDENRILSASGGAGMMVWDLADGKKTKDVACSDARVATVDWKLMRVFISVEGGALELVDFDKGQSLKQFKLSSTSHAMSLDWTSDNALCGADDGTICMWSLNGEGDGSSEGPAATLTGHTDRVGVLVVNWEKKSEEAMKKASEKKAAEEAATNQGAAPAKGKGPPGKGPPPPGGKGPPAPGGKGKGPPPPGGKGPALPGAAPATEAAAEEPAAPKPKGKGKGPPPPGGKGPPLPGAAASGDAEADAGQVESPAPPAGKGPPAPGKGKGPPAPGKGKGPPTPKSVEAPAPPPPPESLMQGAAGVELGSGRQLVKEVLQDGVGDFPMKGDRVEVAYTGTLVHGGKEFDSSSREEPFPFVVGDEGVLPGWNLAVMSMRPKERCGLTIHPALAYGEKGMSNVIPPNAVLHFVMELVAVHRAEAAPASPAKGGPPPPGKGKGPPAPGKGKGPPLPGANAPVEEEAAPAAEEEAAEAAPPPVPKKGKGKKGTPPPLPPGF